MSWLDRDRTIAPPGFNRWLIPPAALAVHLCIGQAYATSVYKTALVAHFDASLVQIGVIFSIAIVMLGLSAAIMGTWVDTNGPRKAMFVAALFWSGGFLIGSLGIFTNQLWLVYVGYGFIGGIGLGIGYISPVSTLIKWFPDRPGLATGMAIMGFGGGALIASPVSTALLSFYDPNSGAANWVASGDSVGKLFLTLAVIYLAYMMFGAFTIKVPAADWVPAGFDPSKVRVKALVTSNHVSARNAIRTRQFWLLWVVLFCNVTAGIGILDSPGRPRRTRPDARTSTWCTSALARCCTCCWRSSDRVRRRSTLYWPSLSFLFTVAVSLQLRPTCGICSEPFRWGPSMVAC